MAVSRTLVRSSSIVSPAIASRRSRQGPPTHRTRISLDCASGVAHDSFLSTPDACGYDPGDLVGVYPDNPATVLAEGNDLCPKCLR